jgi:hypothetical protein
MAAGAACHLYFIISHIVADEYNDYASGDETKNELHVYALRS